MITLTLQGYSPKTMMYIVVFTIPTITIIATDIAMYFKVKSLNIREGFYNFLVDCGSTIPLSDEGNAAGYEKNQRQKRGREKGRKSIEIFNS